MFTPGNGTVRGSLTTSGLLDLIEQRDLGQHLFSDGRAVAPDPLAQAAADVGPAIDQLQWPVSARNLGQRGVGLAGVALQHARGIPPGPWAEAFLPGRGRIGSVRRVGRHHA